MSSAYDYQSPAIRIQQSTPVPQLPAEYLQQSMSVADNVAFQNWNNYNYHSGQMNAAPSLQTPPITRRSRPHQRIPSTSSVASSSPASPYSQGHAPSLSYTGGSDRSPAVSSTSRFDSQYNADQAPQKFSNHLPTPTQTPTSDSFLSQQYQSYPPHFNYAKDASVSMTQAVDNQSLAEEEMPGFTHSGRHSVSSYGHDSPATPHTVPGDEYEYKPTNNGENLMLRVATRTYEYLQIGDETDVRQTVPKFERTETDICADVGYNPFSAAQIPVVTTAPPPITTDTSMLSPPRNAVNAQLLRAYNARSQSPPNSINRAISPFRQGSPLAPTSHSFDPSQPQLGRADRTRERQKAEADAVALQQHIAPPEEEPIKTISPKEAMLDYTETDEDSKVPLFPDGGSNEYGTQYSSSNNQYPGGVPVKYENSSEQTYGNMVTSNGTNWTAPPSISMVYPTTTTSQSNFNFTPPAIPGSMHGLPLTHGYRSVTSAPSAPEETPEFPAHLTSMESSASEAPPSSNNSQNTDVPLQKPAATGADTGTYTCTYHGCTLRFETPQKLQKHKREGHRQSTTAPPTPGVGSGMTSAALLARNSQAGPHKCERINPTTGKPCNTIFSRPYDLTRHEDTIHNARKQKVRCALCIEEKTFSRNDALTRHMRVVHPDVDFPGKHRRRGGSSD